MNIKTTLALSVLLAAAAPAARAVQPGELADNTAAPLIAGREYMVAPNHPNQLNVLDLADNKVLKTCALPDAFGPGSVQISPDRRTAYILNNHFGGIYGIELDTCKVTFSARMSLDAEERAIAVFSVALSPDGKEIYTVQNPSKLHVDRYEVQAPRLAVYKTDAGLDARPARTFPVPRQLSLMQAADDGALYALGPDVYKIDPENGKYEVAVPLLNWKRPGYGAPDVLSAWAMQLSTREFSALYTAPKFKDGQQDLASADFVWGVLSIDLKTGKHEIADFAPLTEIYFTGTRSPANRSHIFTVLNGLRKYDIKAQKLLASASLEHAYYQVNLNRDGSRVYLSGTLQDVAVYDAATLEKIANIRLPGGDMSLSTAQIFVR
ncbi:MAG: quinohemoprotein amine dehydrogenase subunit beta [Azoarcus sp.]|jgi:quinohemoprotein amine dehydrogenase beta subunit|nr:quinohemoprotein amine dehydrogenase subunit beta [Azoarcus sp.]